MPRDDERPSPGPPGRPPSSNPGALPFPPDPRSCVRLPVLRGDGAGRRFGRPAARQHAAERDRCRADAPRAALDAVRSEEHTSELPSLMRISYAVFCLINNTTHATFTVRHKQTSKNTQDYNTQKSYCTWINVNINK